MSVRKSGRKGESYSARPIMLINTLHSKLGGQALVLDVEGTWRELMGIINKLTTNLKVFVFLANMSHEIGVCWLGWRTGLADACVGHL